MIILGIYGAFDWEANKSNNNQGDLTWTHDSGATLFIHGKHISSISEERLTRKKYEGNFPIKSIEYCLREGNVSYEDVDEVYIPSMCIEIFYRKLRDNVIEEKIKKILSSESPEDRMVVALSLVALSLVLVKFYLTGCVVVCISKCKILHSISPSFTRRLNSIFF